MTPAQSLQACTSELKSLLEDIARSTSSARLADSTNQARTEATAQVADLAVLLEQLQTHKTEIQTLCAALQCEAADLSDEQLASIAAGRTDIRTMVLTLAGTLSIATSDGACSWEPPREGWA